MKGLVLKDFLNLRKMGLTFLLLIALFAVIFGMQGDYSFVGVIIIPFCLMVVTTMSYDDVAGWNAYAVTMPVSRRDIVLSKYCTMVLFCLLGVMIGGAMMVVLSLFGKTPLTLDSLWVLGGILAVALVFGSLMIPLIYQFGAEKARFVLIMVALAPTALVIGAKAIFGPIDITFPVMVGRMMPAILTVLTVVIVGMSYAISRRIFARKEL